MKDFDIYAALLADLGGGPDSASIQPATMNQRLAEFAGDELSKIKPVLDGYLERTSKLRFIGGFDSRCTTDQLAVRLATEMPELTPNVRLKLATYFIFANR